MTTAPTEAQLAEIEQQLDELRGDFESQALAAQAGPGYAARLGGHLSAAISRYEKGRPAAPEWRRPRLDVARRLNLAILGRGDDDSAVRLIAGVTGDPAHVDGAIRQLLSPPVNAALESLDAALSRSDDYDHKPFGATPTMESAWMARRSKAALIDDLDHWFRVFAREAHASEVEALHKEGDRLRLRLRRAEQPNAEIAELREKLRNVQDEATGTRARLAAESENVARLEQLAVVLRGKLRTISGEPDRADQWAESVARAVGVKPPAERAEEIDAEILRLAADEPASRELFERVATELRASSGVDLAPDTVRKRLRRLRQAVGDHD